MHEFEIIEHFFNKPIGSHPHIKVGVGDDAAVFELPAGQQLVTSIDTLIASTHFPMQTQPEDIGHKSLAVSLSDMAAMGAKPDSVLLAITLPQADQNWLTEFSRGFFALADQYQVALIGGNVTRGPLSVSTVMQGFVPTGQALLRTHATACDLIYVSGTLGDAGLALDLLQKKQGTINPTLLEKLNRPQPRINLGLELRGIASAAIDISDGLAADLSKILTASHVGAQIKLENLPLSKAMQTNCTIDKARRLALSAGDDYELCFTIAADKKNKLEEKAKSLDCQITCIGEINSQKKLSIIDENKNPYFITETGYQHF